MQDNDSRNSCDQEPAERSLPSIQEKAESCRDAKADQDGDPLHMSVLPANKFVLLKIGDIVVWRIWLQLEKQPADVRVKEAFRNAVRVIVMIDMFMMAAMFARPHQDRVFKRGGAKNNCEKPDRPAGLESDV